MTNKEKAIELVDKTHLYEEGTKYLHTDKVMCETLLEMAQWKESQMIEKAIKFIDENTFGILDDGVPYIQSIHDTSKNEFIEDFKKYMEEQ